MCARPSFPCGRESSRTRLPRSGQGQCVVSRRGGFSINRIPARAEITKQRGISLIELIMFIVIISVALTGILQVMNQVMRHSADPLIRKQAMAVAESLLEEIELQDFISADGTNTAVTPANRASAYHIVADYNGFTTGGAGISDLNGVAVPGLGSYNASVVIANGAFNGIPAASAVRITVTVTDPETNPIVIDGYRTRY